MPLLPQSADHQGTTRARAQLHRHRFHHPRWIQGREEKLLKATDILLSLWLRSGQIWNIRAYEELFGKSGRRRSQDIIIGMELAPIARRANS